VAVKGKSFITSLRDAAPVPKIQRLVLPLEQRGANVPILQQVPQAPSGGSGGSTGGSTSGSTSGSGQSTGGSTSSSTSGSGQSTDK